MGGITEITKAGGSRLAFMAELYSDREVLLKNVGDRLFFHSDG
jgi:hypothetical protein